MEKKISKKALSRSFHHWYYGNLTCFTQEHMQTFGYLASMLPIVEDLYDNKEDQKRSMNTYTAEDLILREDTNEKTRDFTFTFVSRLRLRYARCTKHRALLQVPAS